MKVLLDRWQFGVTITYHFLFVPLTIGLALLVAVMQVLAYRYRDEVLGAAHPLLRPSSRTSAQAAAMMASRAERRRAQPARFRAEGRLDRAAQASQPPSVRACRSGARGDEHRDRGSNFTHPLTMTPQRSPMCRFIHLKV